MGNEQAAQQNEKVLHAFLSRANKKFAPQVGLAALALLTEQLPEDVYAAFLSDCIDNAAELHRVKNSGMLAGPENSENALGNENPSQGNSGG